MYYIKLSDYAKKFGITYRTAWNRYKRGKFPDAIKDETGHVYGNLTVLSRAENSSGGQAMWNCFIWKKY